MCPATLTVLYDNACCYVATLPTIHCIYILEIVAYSLYLHTGTSTCWYPKESVKDHDNGCDEGITSQPWCCDCSNSQGRSFLMGFTGWLASWIAWEKFLMASPSSRTILHKFHLNKPYTPRKDYIPQWMRKHGLIINLSNIVIAKVNYNTQYILGRIIWHNCCKQWWVTTVFLSPYNHVKKSIATCFTILITWWW